MLRKFYKMHGIGNDYIYFDCLDTPLDNPEAAALKLSDRHFGIGGDGIVLICPSALADAKMRMFNADGSEGKMCGNAIRCLGKYLYDFQKTNKTTLKIETLSGVKTLFLNVENGKTQSVKVDMGAPSLSPEQIPVRLGGKAVVGRETEIAGGRYAITCVSMGNPHCVIFVRDPDYVDLEQIGPLLENNAIFPQRANVEFVQVVSRDHLRMRVWERGAGETLACGTGACASIVAAVMTGRADRHVVMDLLGGSLTLDWSPDDGHVYQEGPAQFVFDGEWLGE